MGKFNKNSSSRELPTISTASLPDIIFMLLFFFMATTQLKEVDFKVSIKEPKATELEALDKKNLVRFIYVGTPTDKYRGVYGSETRVQLDDAFADVSQIEDYIVAQRAAMNEYEQSLLTVALRVDEDAKMGIVTDIKQALRRAYALKINYVSRQRDNSQAF